MTRFVPSSGIKQSWLRVLPPAPTNDNSGVVEVGRAEVHVQRTLYPLRFGLWLKKYTFENFSHTRQGFSCCPPCRMLMCAFS